MQQSLGAHSVDVSSMIHVALESSLDGMEIVVQEVVPKVCLEQSVRVHSSSRLQHDLEL